MIQPSLSTHERLDVLYTPLTFLLNRALFKTIISIENTKENINRVDLHFPSIYKRIWVCFCKKRWRMGRSFLFGVFGERDLGWGGGFNHLIICCFIFPLFILLVDVPHGLIKTSCRGQKLTSISSVTFEA